MFLKEKKFWLNFFTASGSVILIIFLLFQGFSFYTRHDSSVEVPNVVGVPMEEAKRNLENKGFIVEIVDSLYDIPVDLKDKGIEFGDVIVQNPQANDKVKKGRRFYLTVRTSNPPMVEMPNLLDLSLRQAISVIEAKGLVFSGTGQKSDLPVSTQLYEGKIIKPGTKIPKGSIINLLVDSVDVETGEVKMVSQ